MEASSPWPLTKSFASDLSPMIDGHVSKDSSTNESRCRRIKGALFPSVVIGMILTLVTVLFFYGRLPSGQDSQKPCEESCRFDLIESAGRRGLSKDIMSRVLHGVQESMQIITVAPATTEESWLLNVLKSENTSNVKVTILVDSVRRLNQTMGPLFAMGGVEVKELKVKNIHSQFVIIDGSSFYLVNSQYLSLVSGILPPASGVLVSECSCITTALTEMFDINYRSLTEKRLSGQAKDGWHFEKEGNLTSTNPLFLVSKNGATRGVFYITTVSPLLSPSEKFSDLDALLDVLNASYNEYVYISNRVYNPGVHILTNNRRYWPAIDEVLRAVLYETNTNISFLTLSSGGSGVNTDDMADASFCIRPYIRTLDTFIQSNSRMFNRSKDSTPPCYAVTDSSFYYGSCNWTGDYFLTDRFSISIIGTNISSPVTSDGTSTSPTGRDKDLRLQLVDHFLQSRATNG